MAARLLGANGKTLQHETNSEKLAIKNTFVYARVEPNRKHFYSNQNSTFFLFFIFAYSLFGHTKFSIFFLPLWLHKNVVFSFSSFFFRLFKFQHINWGEKIMKRQRKNKLIKFVVNGLVFICVYMLSHRLYCNAFLCVWHVLFAFAQQQSSFCFVLFAHISFLLHILFTNKLHNNQ